jgi:hypothetical protein
MKTKKIPRARYGPHAWRDGRCLDADDARAFAQSVHEYFVRTHSACLAAAAPLHLFPLGEFILSEAGTRQLAEHAALREHLSYCTCGGKASDHREDRDGNLLKCNHCSDCDHFRNRIEEAA